VCALTSDCLFDFRDSSSTSRCICSASKLSAMRSAASIAMHSSFCSGTNRSASGSSVRCFLPATTDFRPQDDTDGYASDDEQKIEDAHGTSSNIGARNTARINTIMAILSRNGRSWGRPNIRDVSRKVAEAAVPVSTTIWSRPNSDAGGEVSGPAAKPFSVSNRQTKDLGKTSIGEPPSM